MYNLNSKKRNNNKKPIYTLLIFIGVFTLFIYFLIKPSLEKKAINEINNCINTEDVKKIFEKYKNDLNQSEDFLQSTRDRIKSFGLNQSNITDVKKWLPSKTDNINIVIVPDLSNRITDAINNADQIKRDTTIISSICETFENRVKTKMNSKDKLLIDITDRKQAGGKISELADTLIYDLSNFKDKINKLYFENHKESFKKGLRKLYDFAYDFELSNPKGGGADYVSYFSSKLKSKIQKSTLDDNYRNVLIILTDGYLDATKPNGDIVSYINIDPNTIIETSLSKYKDLEVYLFEVNRRKKANDFDEIKLKKWWLSWLNSMNVKNSIDTNSEDEIIIKRQDGFTDIKKKIEDILNKN